MGPDLCPERDVVGRTANAAEAEANAAKKDDGHGSGQAFQILLLFSNALCAKGPRLRITPLYRLWGDQQNPPSRT